MTRFFIVLASTIALSLNCASNAQKSDIDSQLPTNIKHDQTWHTLPEGVFNHSENVCSGDTIGFITGRFFSEKADTLYCVALGCSSISSDDEDPYSNVMDCYRLTNKRLGVKDLYLTGIPGIYNLIVTDLDCDGLDEFEMHLVWYTSCWQSYGAFDYYNGEWVELCDHVSFYACDDPDDLQIIRHASPTKLLVRESGWNDDMTEILAEWKYIPIKRQPVFQRFDKCYTRPGGQLMKLPVKASREE